MSFRVAALVAAGLGLWFAAAQSPPGQPAASPRDRLERAYRASNRGVALLEQYDYPAAASAFREALQNEPALAAAHLNLSIALLYAGEPDAALPEARSAASALPNAPQPSFVLGLIARVDNRVEDAEAAFRRVIEIDRTDAASNVNLGQLLLQKRQYTEAVAAFRAAVAAEPYNATAAYGLATALTRSGDTGAGQQQMARFQTLRDSAYAVTYAQGYLQQGRYGEAIVSTGAEPELVDRSAPKVTFADAGAIGAAPAGQQGAVAEGGVSTLLFDADGDNDLDLLTTGGAATTLWRNDRGRFTHTDAIPSAAEPEGRASAGDFDNDGHADLFIAGRASSRLLHQRANGTFEDVTRASGIPATLHPGAASWVDVDHDGDVDLVTAGPIRLLRNNGNGTFVDVTREAGLSAGAEEGSGPAIVVPTDYDNRRDVDLLIVSGGGAPRLFRNMRDGTFQDVAAAAGLPREPVSAVAAADINKDGFIDFFFARVSGAAVFALSDGREHFVTRDAPSVSASASVAQFVDYDNDGLLDLVAITANGLRLLRNVGDGWSDDSSRVTIGAGIRSIALGDVDADGDTDVIAARSGADAHLWRNDGGNAHRSIAVSLAARVSNRSGLGAKVEIRAGSLRQMLETSAASPAVGPADLVFGLGSREAADVVRVLWPSGILQTELDPGAKTRVEELDRKPSSCPYLYTWNGSRFEFITDFLGGGEMGDWVGPGQFNTPDPDEYVRITGDQLRARDGRYDIRITNELEEAMFLDRVRLLVVDHPADEDVYPNEGLKDAPRPPFRLYATRDAHVPDRVIDDHGHDVRALVATRDRRWPDDFARAAIRGYAAPHTLTMSVGNAWDRAVLLLTGWTGYAFSSDNVAASQAGLVLQPPVIDVRDATGRWVTVENNVGFPVGRPQTVVVDLAGKWRGPSRDVRLSTTMPIYWDQVLVATADESAPRSITTLEPVQSTLHWRGFSAETSADGREPFGADYEKVSSISPWKTFAGAYTREGDVRSLLAKTDDMFVVAKPGDEIALSFDATAAPPLRQGWRRTFLLYADGFSKEMNIRSATPDSLGPLPFHGMSRYPLAGGEHYPRDEAHTRYLEHHNTRIVPRAIPSIDAAVAGRRQP